MMTEDEKRADWDAITEWHAKEWDRIDDLMEKNYPNFRGLHSPYSDEKMAIHRELCRRIKAFHAKHGIKPKHSD